MAFSLSRIRNSSFPLPFSSPSSPPISISFLVINKRWATNLGGRSTQNGRDSIGKRLGVKLGNGATALENQIIIRQRGYQYWPGSNVKAGKDHTLHAACKGKVHFSKDHDTVRTFVNVIPSNPQRLPNSKINGFMLADITQCTFREKTKGCSQVV